MAMCTPGQHPYGSFAMGINTGTVPDSFAAKVLQEAQYSYPVDASNVLFVNAPSPDDSSSFAHYDTSYFDGTDTVHLYSSVYSLCDGGYIPPPETPTPTGASDMSILILVSCVAALFFAGILGYRQGGAA